MRRHPKTAAMLMTLGLASVTLAGCSGGGTADNQLTWYINPDGGGSDPAGGGQAQLAAECSESSGGAYSIKIQLLPNSASDQRQQLLRRLAAADPGMDLMSLDPVFVAEFAEAEYLEPVPQDKQDALTEDAVKPIIEAATWRDKLVAAPMWANTQLFWYRKSLAQQAGLDMSQPVTWEQVVQAAKSQNRTIGVQSKLYEGYMVWINALVAGAGGEIVDNPGASAKDLQLGLESPAGEQAAGIISSVSSSGVGGPAMSSSDETAALDLFVNDSSSMFLANWPYVWAALPEKNVSFIDDVGWTRYPRSDPDKESRPPLGGIELGVNAASQKKDLAWEAIQCITSQEHQTDYMLGTGNPAARKAVYDDPQVIEKFPMAALIRESLDAGAPRPLSQYYGDISAAVTKVFSPPSSVNQSTPAEATRFTLEVVRGEALL